MGPGAETSRLPAHHQGPFLLTDTLMSKENKMKTNNAKHTNGPWEIRDVAGTGKMFSIMSPNTIPEGQCLIAQLPRTFGTENLRTQEADARLIAAAPDLLEACKFALDSYISSMSSDYDFPGSRWIDRDGPTDPTVVSLRAAIAKAEGVSK